MANAGQVAIITGGAGGIGYAAAEELARRKAKVCLVDITAASLTSAQDRLRANVPGAEVMTVALDVTDVASVDSGVRSVMSRWGRVDILVQAAGITGKTNVKTDAVEPDNFDLVLRVNLRGIFLFCRAVLPIMKRQGYGRIVNIASIAGKEGNAGMLAYSTSKAAVIGLTKVIGKEFAEEGDVRSRDINATVALQSSARMLTLTRVHV